MVSSLGLGHLPVLACTRLPYLCIKALKTSLLFSTNYIIVIRKTESAVLLAMLFAIVGRSQGKKGVLGATPEYLYESGYELVFVVSV